MSKTQTVHVTHSPAPHVPDGVVWHVDEPEPVITAVNTAGRLSVSEFTLDRSGAASPFGDDLRFPMPVEHLRYQPPSPAEPGNVPED